MSVWCETIVWFLTNLVLDLSMFRGSVSLLHKLTYLFTFYRVFIASKITDKSSAIDWRSAILRTMRLGI